MAWINAECLRAVAEWQKYAIANPTWQPFDRSIYSPEHIILTAPPEMIGRLIAQAPKIEGSAEVERMLPDLATSHRTRSVQALLHLLVVPQGQPELPEVSLEGGQDGRVPPQLGEHSTDVLTWLGYTLDDVRTLKSHGLVQ